VKTYLAQRLGIAALTLFGMSVVIFVLLRIAPGDIVDILFSTGGYVNPSERAAIEKELGLDKPIWLQYVDWLRNIATGDLGKSYRYDLPAWEIIKPLFPVTLELAILSMIVAVVLGVPTGVISAVRQDTTLDYILRVLSLAGLAMPSFWLGMVIILALVAWIGWIPPMTYVPARENFSSTSSSSPSPLSPWATAPPPSSCASRAPPSSRSCERTTSGQRAPRGRGNAPSSGATR